MAPLRARARRLIEDGNAWLLVILVLVIVVTIVASTYVTHQAISENTVAIVELHNSLDANTEQSKTNYALIKLNRENIVAIQQAVADFIARTEATQ